MNKLLALLGLPAVMASTYSIDGGKTTYFRQINHQMRIRLAPANGAVQCLLCVRCDMQ